MISNHKGCNIPSGKISIEVPTQKDKEDLKLIAKLGPEYVAVSFVGSAADVKDVQKCLTEYGNSDIKIISKVERPIALVNIDEIINASYGVMVARGDLGVEIPPEEVPIAQKSIVKKCNRVGRPVIVATQMLESMTANSRPTRAEASDVFNAVLDGADAVMLSEETSVGKYPIESVKYMDTIAATAEKHMPERNPSEYDSLDQGIVETLGHSCFTTVNEFHNIGYTGKIIAATDSGYTVRMISKYRPNLPIIAMTSSLRTARELNLVWGVRTIYSDSIYGTNLEERMINSIKKAFAMNLLKKGDHAIVISKSMISDWGSYLGVFDVNKIME